MTSPQLPPITIAILAGGKSRRMGRDKTALIIDGETLLERTARATLGMGLPVVVVGLIRPDGWMLDSVQFMPDAMGDLGPLGGLVTALRHEVGCGVLLLACDLPKLTTRAIAWLLDAARANSGPDGLIVENAERREPLFSLYAAQSLALAEARIAADRLSMNGLIETGDFATITAPNWIQEHLVNVNTPEDFQPFDVSKPG